MFTSVALRFQLMRKTKEGAKRLYQQHGNCKAQFPRKTFDETEVDSNTGALNIKKVKSGSTL